MTDERMLEPTQGPFVGYLPARAQDEADDHSIERLAAASVRRAQSLIRQAGLLEQLLVIQPHPASDAALLRVHSAQHLERVRRVAATGGGWLGHHTWGGPGEDVRAVLAAGACITAVETVLDGVADNAYALVWPPGHHALRESASGFCVFGNVAVAAAAAHARGADRIAIIDWDAHRGDGTHVAFSRSTEILTVSLHQERPGVAPSSGVAAIDIALPAGAGWPAYEHAFAMVVEPMVTAHRPDLIMVSAGFDASTLDPMARMMLHSRAYRHLTTRTLALAEANCLGRVVFCHEGGYAPAYVPICVLAVVEALSGTETGWDDPFLEAWGDFSGDRLRESDVKAVAESAPRIG